MPEPENVEVTDEQLESMAGGADVAGLGVLGTTDTTANDTGTVATELDGWSTAAELAKVHRQWSAKATACGQSVLDFGGALRTTVTWLTGEDELSAAGIDASAPETDGRPFADDPILATEPPWHTSAPPPRDGTEMPW